MKLRVRKSEYQRAYAEPSQNFFDTIYMEQLSYRRERRDKENEHMVFKWESESSDSISDSANNIQIPSPSQTVDGNTGEERLKSAYEDKEVVISETDQDASFYVNTSTQTPTFSRKSRPKSSRASSRDVHAGKPPFVSYGWADDQKETGKKKTHNVQAPAQSVHRTALQRLNYIQSEKKKQKQKSISRASLLLSKAIFQKKQSDSLIWQTEYQRCFSRQSERPASSPTETKCARSKLRKTGLKKK